MFFMKSILHEIEDILQKALLFLFLFKKIVSIQ
jgi:hypothetical protein